MKFPFRKYIDLLGKYFRALWPLMAGLVVLMFVGIALQLYGPQVLRRFIDTAMGGGSDGELFRIAALYLAVALGTQCLAIGQRWIGTNLAWTATNSLRVDVAGHCLRLDMSFHKSRTPGELIQRVDGDVGVLGNFFSNFLVQVLSNFLLMFGALVMLYHEDWRIGVVLTGFAVGTLVVMSLLRRIAVPAWQRAFQADAMLYAFLEERLAGTEDVRASGATAYVMRRFFELMRAVFRKHMVSALLSELISAGSRLSFVIGQVLALAISAWLFLRPDIDFTIGTVFLVSNYMHILQGPLSGLTGQLQYLQQSGASIERVGELLEIQTKIEDGPGLAIAPGPLAVEFRDVTFHYVEEEKVLDDISFRLEPGRVLGLLGRTGSGKTTLTRLLFRLYDPGTGSIRLDGVEVRAAELDQLRRRIGMVTQEVQLFHASVRDNLTFFDPSVSEEEILAAMEKLGLGAWVASLPEGLNTILESGGGGLSAGEAQLLAFTRVFLSDPGLVILDEASSRLDPATEELIEHAIDALLENRTGIIVAHRLATVQRVDEIMILEGGRIIEHGERERLAADPQSRFYGLLQTGLEEAMA